MEVCRFVFMLATCGLVVLSLSQDNGIAKDLISVMLKVKNGGLKKGATSFSALLSKDTNPNKGAVIKFDKVMMNIGGGYSSSTGIFTTPTSGLYLISSTLRSNNGKYLNCALMVNDKSYTSGPGTNSSTGRINIAVELKKGDQVYVKESRDNEDVLGSNFSVFSGYLLV